jgi:phospholipid/cholesterol/gamma-HCH transport system substrate-binding protein
MNRNVIETILGAAVLAGAGLFLSFAFKSADLKPVKGYEVVATFGRADGLKNGGDVMLNGVKVGSVLDQKLVTEVGKDQFLVRVRMSIDPKVSLPTDTVAMIANESLLGGRYLSLEIGSEEETIKTDGTGKITRTQPPLRLDDLIGKLLFSKNETPEATKAETKPAIETKSETKIEPPMEIIPSEPSSLPAIP